MKKEIFAVVLLGALLSSTLYNIRYLGRFLEGIEEYVDASERCAETSDYESAAQYLREGIDKWNSGSHYTSILLRHSDIESTSDAFYDLLAELYIHDGKSAKASYMKLRSHLHGISDMEQITLWSIF